MPGKEPRGRILHADDPDWDAARKVFNDRFDRRPEAIVYCADAEDVAASLAWARASGLPLSLRSGGHSFEASSVTDGGVVLDLSRLHEVRVDRENRLAEIGAGHRIGPITEELWRHGLTLPLGTCPSVGIAGLTLGGGLSLLSRLWGLTCDNLLKAELVLADGSRVAATEIDHPELLWACRGGGGGNFGIATSFVFRLHPIDTVSIFRLVWPFEDLPAVLSAWQEWAPAVDERLGSMLQLKSAETREIVAFGQYVGPEFELNQLIRPLVAAGRPFELETVELPFIEAFRLFAGARFGNAAWAISAGTPCFKGGSDFALWPLSADGIARLQETLREAPSVHCLVQLESCGGAMARPREDSTAFPYRAGALYSLQYVAAWHEPAEEEPHLSWFRGLREALNPYLAGAAYLNYPDADLASWPEAYYGDNLARLVRLKQKYDPEGLFRFAHGVPLEMPSRR
jgi:FAD/FMN-containing dehydrogenase